MNRLSHSLETPQPHGHFVQLYDNDITLLASNVARYLAAGLKRAECALIIATPEHNEKFRLGLAELGVNPAQAIADSKLVVLDTVQTLGEFMIDGQPDWARFEKVIAAVRSRFRVSSPTGMRAYGEMVGVLWTSGQYTAAVRLEEFWNKLLGDGGFTLFCSYPIDIFAKDFQVSGVDALLCDHTHLIPTGIDGKVENAIDRAIDARMGAAASDLKTRIDDKARINDAGVRASWAVMPRAEGLILWLRSNMPREAEDILNLACQYYRAALI